MTRIYPGMLDGSKEYFISGTNVMKIHNGKIRNFDEVEHHPELAQIISEEKDLQRILQDWHGSNEREKHKTLARCRFGALNFFADFNDDESTPDYTICPLRGTCKGENIVCKNPVINGEAVTIDEITILKEITTEKSNIEIAKSLGYPLGTFNVKKTNLYQKININNKQEAVITLMFEGLL